MIEKGVMRAKNVPNGLASESLEDFERAQHAVLDSLSAHIAVIDESGDAPGACSMSSFNWRRSLGVIGMAHPHRRAKPDGS